MRKLILLTSVLTLACDDDPTPPRNDDGCGAVDLPLQGTTNAPVLTDIRLEVRPLVVELFATATDPQGSGNINNVVQTIHVFHDQECEGGSTMLQDDFAGSDIEESFDNVVAKGENEAFYDAIFAADTWPVEVDIRDGDGNRTTGRIRAEVVLAVD